MRRGASAPSCGPSRRIIELLFKGTGLAAEVDHAALAEAFSRWRQAFDQTKHLADIDRHDFVIFAAGHDAEGAACHQPDHRDRADEGWALPALPARSTTG